MRLQSFQIQNYRSISDSGVVNLSENDNITVLAGQNESGKSSILTALRDFKVGSFDPESEPFTTGESKEQVISCTFLVEDSDDLFSTLSKLLITKYGLQIGESESILDIKILNKINIFTLTRTKKENLVKFSIDDTTFNIFKSSILEKHNSENEAETDSSTHTDEESHEKYLIIDDNKIEEVANIFFELTPTIVFFDDFCDLLPDKILLSDLSEQKTDVEGYKAVRNLETILNIDFVKKDGESDPVRRTKEDNENEKLSVDFQQDWGQRIHGENEVLVEYAFEKRTGEGVEGSYVYFTVKTRRDQPLPPKKRSKGLVWFLSLWLELKTLDADNTNLVLLLDEPDQHLHVKAQKDILKLINKLALGEDEKEKQSGNQVIYATHSPYLIEAEYINRIKLVINNESEGTKVEDILSSKINTDYKRDALQPISDAIGLSTGEFSILSQKNVLLEGVSDFYYFMAMKKILNRAGDYKFVPGIGVRQINNLISLCIGYGLEWVVIIDDDPSKGGKDSKKKFDVIKDFVFDGDSTKTAEKVRILKGTVGIENMFDPQDLKLTGAHLGRSKDMVNAVGKKRKILISREFFEKVQNGEIVKANISKNTIKNFTDAFDFIQEALEL